MAGAPGFTFDQRPGDLEAARAVDACVAGRRDADGWKVLLLGCGLQVAVTPQRARALAEELITMADVCEGKWGI